MTNSPGAPTMLRIQPRVLHFHVTSRCPYHCPHCCSDAGPEHPPSEIGVEGICELIEKASRFGMDEFELSGGEPLVLGREAVLRILGHAAGRRMVTTLNTNTWFLDAEYALALREAGLDRLKTSLYGTSAGHHDAFTGKPGSFERLMRALAFLRDLQVEVWVHYVVNPENLEDAPSLLPLLEPFGVDTIQVGVAVPTGRGGTGQDCLFGDDELERVLRRLESVFPDTRRSNVSFTISLYPSQENRPFGDRYCDYLTDRLVVDPSGRVLPCCVLPEDLRHPGGSLLEQDIPGLLSDPGLKGDPVFSWLAKGHQAMEQRLGFRPRTPNLCSACISMLRRLAHEPTGRST